MSDFDEIEFQRKWEEEHKQELDEIKAAEDEAKKAQESADQVKTETSDSKKVAIEAKRKVNSKKSALTRQYKRDLAKAKGKQREEDPKVPETSEPTEIEIGPSNPEDGEDDEMSQTKNLLSALQNSMPSFPGLDCDAIVSKLIEKNKGIQDTLQPYKKAVDDANKLKDSDAIKKAEQNLQIQMDSYKSQLKSTVDEQIAIIKTNFKTITDGCKSIGEVIPSFIANMAIPKVIVVGSAAGTANPATALIEAKQFKATCGSILNTIKIAAVSLLQACIKIKLPVPEVVKVAIEGISVLESIINSIP